MNKKNVFNLIIAFLLVVGLMLSPLSGQRALAQAGTDIQVDSFTSPLGLNDIVVDYTIVGTDAPSFDLGFYRSADNLYDGADEQLSLVTIGDPADLTVGTHSKVFTLGTNLDLVNDVAGSAHLENTSDYFVLAVADPSGAVAESDETNNTEEFEGVYQYVNPATRSAVFVHGGEADEKIWIDAYEAVFIDKVGSKRHQNISQYRIRGHAGSGALFSSPSSTGSYLIGGPGDDYLIPGLTFAIMDGGEGNDMVRFTNMDRGVKANLGTGQVAWNDGTAYLLNSKMISIENLHGSPFADELKGSEAANVIEGGDGDDTILAYGGDDTINGGNGNDTLYGGDGNDTIEGWAGDDLLFGNAGNDVLKGAYGNDTLRGETGDDMLSPSFGNDLVSGGDGIDTITFADAANGVVCDLTQNMATGQGTDAITNGTVENILGTPYDDTLRGNPLANRIAGSGGNDIIYGYGGNDVLLGGQGADQLFGGVGDDSLYAVNDTCVDDGAVDLLNGNVGTDTGYGVLEGPTADTFHSSVENKVGCPAN